MASKKKAVVIGCDVNGLGVIGSLSKAGIEVMAVPTASYEVGHFSRFCSERSNMLSPSKEEEVLLDLLLSARARWRGALLVPTTDEAVIFVSKHRDLLATAFVPAVLGQETMEKIMNKKTLYRKAGELGLPVPKVFFPESVEELISIKDELPFPCLIKPSFSHLFYPLFGAKLFVVHSFSELAGRFAEIRGRGIDVVLSEIIPGPDRLLYCYKSYTDGKGDILAEMCFQKLRQYPPGFGVGRAARTVPIIEEVKDVTRKILHACSCRGFAGAEFKYDERDGRYKLIEINVRFELQERLSTAAGINFPAVMYGDLVEKASLPAKNRYSVLSWVDSFMDFLGYVKLRKEGKMTFGEFMRPYFRKKVFSVPFWSDPLPFLARGYLLARQSLRAFSLR